MIAIAAVVALGALFACVLWLIRAMERLQKDVRRSRVEEADRIAAARQDPASDEHHYTLGTLIGDTHDWITRRGATWTHGPQGFCLLITAPGQPELTARPGDTLHWDGQRISVTRPE
ncbi:hypothetical protein [Streptomyces goshikiensis]|uniref:hypothetical protein n=1 Tax=Streptomyces goshikiensis TaxID=1942 RepID=UPI0036AD1C40